MSTHSGSRLLTCFGFSSLLSLSNGSTSATTVVASITCAGGALQKRRSLIIDRASVILKAHLSRKKWSACLINKSTIHYAHQLWERRDLRLFAPNQAFSMLLEKWPAAGSDYICWKPAITKAYRLMQFGHFTRVAHQGYTDLEQGATTITS